MIVSSSGSRSLATADSPGGLRAVACARTARSVDTGGANLSFESWLDEAEIRDEVTAAAIKAVIARSLQEMKKIIKQRMAALMNGIVRKT